MIVMMNEKLVRMMVDEIVTHTKDWTRDERVEVVRALLKDPEIGGVITGCEKREIVVRCKQAWSEQQL